MAMDPFKKVFFVALAVSLVAMGFVAYIAADALAFGRIPDSESGVVEAKGPVMDKQGASYFVSLDTGKTLYIESNSTLYEELAVGSSYSFTCRIVFLADIIVIDSAELQP
ncbi:MAG: hypothetical protein ACM3UY_02040 [Methanocella sp.]|jgi:hypothetical protein